MDKQKTAVEGRVVLIKRSHAAFPRVIKNMLNEGKIGVYLTFYTKHQKLFKWLKEELAILPDELFFIDPLAKENTAENVFVVKTPRDLTDMFIVITELMGEEDVEFLILDTVEDLVFYNGFERARTFLNALIRYVKRKGKMLILLTREREDEQEEKIHHLAKTLVDEYIGHGEHEW